eukprot:gene9239-6492_t
MHKKGNISIWCNSNVYLGPDSLFSLLLPVLVGCGTLLFAFFTKDVLAAQWIALILYAVTMILYCAAAFRDPGIIDRGEPLPPEAPRPSSRWLMVPNYTNTTGDPALDYYLVEQRWCFTCHIYRPLRSVHCRFCDVCVHRRDHHCPWIGICVASRNYIFFYFMLWFLEALLITVAIGSTHSLILRVVHISRLCKISPDDSHCDTAPLLRAFSETYGIELVLIFLSYLVSLFVAAMLIDQTQMSLHNEVLPDKNHFNGRCVYDKGNWWANLKGAFFFSPAEVALYEVAPPPNETVTNEIDDDDTRSEVVGDSDEILTPDAISAHSKLTEKALFVLLITSSSFFFTFYTYPIPMELATAPFILRALLKDKEAVDQHVAEPLASLLTNTLGARFTNQYDQLILCASKSAYVFFTMLRGQTLGDEFCEMLAVTAGTPRRPIGTIRKLALAFLYGAGHPAQVWISRRLFPNRQPEEIAVIIDRVLLCLLMLFERYRTIRHRVLGIRFLSLRHPQDLKQGSGARYTYLPLGLLLALTLLVQLYRLHRSRHRGSVHRVTDGDVNLESSDSDDSNTSNEDVCTVCFTTKKNPTCTPFKVPSMPPNYNVVIVGAPLFLQAEDASAPRSRMMTCSFLAETEIYPLPSNYCYFLMCWYISDDTQISLPIFVCLYFYIFLSSNREKMKAVEEAIAKSLNEVELSLVGMGLRDIEPYTAQLSQMPNLAVLRLNDNQLHGLPEDLSRLLRLETLDLTGNPISNADSVIPGLLSLPNLKHLMITLPEQKDEDTIIISLLALQSFNGTYLNGDDGGEGSSLSPAQHNIYPEELKNSSSNIRNNIDCSTSSPWEACDALHKSVSSSLPCDVVSSESYTDFKERVLRYASILTAAEHNSDVQIGETLKARRVLTDYCFEEALAAAESAATSHNSQQGMSVPFARALRDIQHHYSALLDDYDRHWRAMAKKNEEQVVLMRSELSGALREVESLLPVAQHVPGRSPSYSEGREMHRWKAASRSLTSRGKSPRDKSKDPIGRQSSNPGELRPTESSHNATNKKVLTLRQLVDLIDNIYSSKEKYDQRCASHKLPSETMEQYMYTYLTQRYGLREIIVEYAGAIAEGIKRYGTEQNEVAVFAKILRNDIDEGFRYVQQQIRNTVPDLLRFFLKERLPGRSDQEIQLLVQQKMESVLIQPEWKFVTEYMYSPEDASFIQRLIEKDIKQQPEEHSAETYKYESFLRLLLDFQLDGHARFLAPFVSLFRRHDHDGDGVINRSELSSLLQEACSQESAGRILSRLAPSCELITFSESIALMGDEISCAYLPLIGTMNACAASITPSLFPRSGVSEKSDNSNECDTYAEHSSGCTPSTIPFTPVELSHAFQNAQKASRPASGSRRYANEALERIHALHASQLNIFLLAYMYPREKIPEKVLDELQSLCCNNDPDWVYRCQRAALDILTKELQARSQNTCPRMKLDDPSALVSLRGVLPCVEAVPKAKIKQCHFFYVGCSPEDIQERFARSKVIVKNKGWKPFTVEISQTQTVVDGNKIDVPSLLEIEGSGEVKPGDRVELCLTSQSSFPAVFSSWRQLTVISVGPVRLFSTITIVSLQSDRLHTTFPECVPVTVKESPLGSYSAPIVLQWLKHLFVLQHGYTSPSVSHLLLGKSVNFTLHNASVVRQAEALRHGELENLHLRAALESFWEGAKRLQNGGGVVPHAPPPSSCCPSGFTPEKDLPTRPVIANAPFFPNNCTAAPAKLANAPPAVILSLILQWLAECQVSIFDTSCINCDPISLVAYYTTGYSMVPQHVLYRSLSLLCCAAAPQVHYVAFPLLPRMSQFNRLESLITSMIRFVPGDMTVKLSKDLMIRQRTQREEASPSVEAPPKGKASPDSAVHPFAQYIAGLQSPMSFGDQVRATRISNYIIFGALGVSFPIAYLMENVLVSASAITIAGVVCCLLFLPNWWQHTDPDMKWVPNDEVYNYYQELKVRRQKCQKELLMTEMPEDTRARQNSSDGNRKRRRAEIMTAADE